MTTSEKPYSAWASVAPGFGITVLSSSALYGFLSRIAPELPARIPVHWDLAGTPDRFVDQQGFLNEMLWMSLIPVFMFALGAAVCWWQSRTSGHPLDLRFPVASSAGVAIMMGGAQAWTYQQLRGVTDASHSPNPTFTLLIAGVVGVVVAAVLWKTFTRSPGPDAPPPGPRIALEPEERVVWVRTVMSPVWLQVMMWGVVAMVAFGYWATGGHLSLLVLCLVSAALAVVFTSFVVRVDEHGFHWKSRVGLMGGSIPLDQVAEASTIEVKPLEYGGWGYRLTPGGTGLIMRSGEALRVMRRKGSTFTVTVDDADTAAALLNSLRERHLSARR